MNKARQKTKQMLKNLLLTKGGQTKQKKVEREL